MAIIGGGPAGLSAGILLARARRRVLVLDHGRPRNAATSAVHGLLGREGIAPADLLAAGRDELSVCGGEVRHAEAIRARRGERGFEIEGGNGSLAHASMLLLAGGIRDRLPGIEGIDALYGTSVHHCPYCDGWEWRDHALAVYGRGRNGHELAHALLTWSSDVVLFTDGARRFNAMARAELGRRGVRVVEEPITRLEGRDGRLERIHFATRAPIARDAMFLATGWRLEADLPRSLGCRLTRAGAIWTDRKQWTGVPGIYAAGDAAGDLQSVTVAAAHGIRAGVSINTELQRIARAAALRTSAGRTAPRASAGIAGEPAMFERTTS